MVKSNYLAIIGKEIIEYKGKLAPLYVTSLLYYENSNMGELTTRDLVTCF